MTAPAAVFPDVERFLVAAFTGVVADRVGTPHPNLVVAPPYLRVQRVPGGPGSQPWQIRPQVELVHYGATRAAAWDLEQRTDAMLRALNPCGGTLAGVFVDSALKVADPALIVDDNPELRPVVTVWRLAIRPQPDPLAG